MDYHFAEDIKAIREMLGMTQAGLAAEIGMQQVTLSRSEIGRTKPSDRLLEYVYGFAYEKNIRLGRLKEMLCCESIKPGHRLLFYGAKDLLEGENVFDRIGAENAIAHAFCAVEKYDQAASAVAGFKKSSVIYLDFDEQNLKCKRYTLTRDWILTFAYYRGALEKYENHPTIRKLITESQSGDYIIAPIADNRMLQIINSFITGEITDVQCKHCLAAMNLGNQYVFTSEQAAKRLRILERSYISVNEREYYKRLRNEETRLSDDKVKLARIQYRGKGRYIDEILK